MFMKRTVATVLGMMLISGAIINQRCSQNNPQKSSTVADTATATPTTTTTPTPTGGVNSSSIDVPDMKACNSQGKVWIPSSISCLENLTPWPCCDAQVLARFTDPNIYSDSFINNLKTQMKTWESQNYKMYNCGKVDDNNYNLYFIIDNGNGNYLGQVIRITKTPATEPTTPVTCP